MVETYRNLCSDDFADLSALAQDWSVVRQLGGFRWPYDAAQIRDRCQPFKGDGFVWAICRNDRMIGSVGVVRGDIGYMLAPSFHGQGITARAVMRAISEAFAADNRPALTGSTWHDNPASAGLLGKMGFVHWQTNYVRSIARGLPVLVHHWRLPRHAWDALRSPAR